MLSAAEEAAAGAGGGSTRSLVLRWKADGVLAEGPPAPAPLALPLAASRLRASSRAASLPLTGALLASLQGAL